MPSVRSWAAAAAILIAPLGAPPASAGVVERDVSAPSKALGRPIVFSVYKPSAAPAPGQRWPVLYLLHGGGPGEADWLDAGGLAATMDKAIATGAMPPTVVIMPLAGNSWYVDNADASGEGAMETALTRDLVNAVDARLPTADCRQGRAVAGLSMGGYGALLFAFDKPREFGAAISLSGSITPPLRAEMTARMKRARYFYDGAFGTPLKIARFNSWNLFPRVQRIGLGGSPKPAVYLDAGDKDPGGIVQGTTNMHLQLLDQGVDSTLRVVGGTHEWALWKRELAPALAWLGPRLDATCGQPMATARTQSDEAAR